jgi:hypothetical protein
MRTGSRKTSTKQLTGRLASSTIYGSIKQCTPPSDIIMPSEASHYSPSASSEPRPSVDSPPPIRRFRRPNTMIRVVEIGLRCVLESPIQSAREKPTPPPIPTFPSSPSPCCCVDSPFLWWCMAWLPRSRLLGSTPRKVRQVGEMPRGVCSSLHLRSSLLAHSCVAAFAGSARAAADDQVAVRLSNGVLSSCVSAVASCLARPPLLLVATRSHPQQRRVGPAPLPQEQTSLPRRSRPVGGGGARL